MVVRLMWLVYMISPFPHCVCWPFSIHMSHRTHSNMCYDILRYVWSDLSIWSHSSHVVGPMCLLAFSIRVDHMTYSNMCYNLLWYIWYGVATISRMLKNIGLFCKRALQHRPVFCKETCIFKHPTHRSHPIWLVYMISTFLHLGPCVCWPFPFLWIT